MFFKHKYLTQPSVTPIDAVFRASEDLCQILKGLPPVKGDTRTAVDMLMDIFKNVGPKDETEVDKQHSRMGAAAEARTKSSKAEETGIWIEPDEAELVDDDLRTTRHVEIRHSGNHIQIQHWGRSLEDQMSSKTIAPDQEGCLDGNNC